MNGLFTSRQFYDALPSRLAPREETIRILFIGDIIGRPGRKIVKQVLPAIRRAGGVDVTIANVENLAGGFGITEKTFAEMANAGVDVMTLGNHWNDKPDALRMRGNEPRLVFPFNLIDGQPVEFAPEFDIAGRDRTLVMLNYVGLFAMKPNYGNPFEDLERKKPHLDDKFKSGRYVIVADIHAEASSEKHAVAGFLDGTAAVVVGTHTHIPTSDERVSGRGTAFLTDLGMTGPYNSIIGMDTARTLRRYFRPIEKGPHEVAMGDSWFCALLVEVSPKTNLCVAAHRLQFREEIDVWSVTSARPRRG
jgi:metallophosphoesterase (TIGR00282 family)